jgi:subtilisin family serine protease
MTTRNSKMGAAVLILCAVVAVGAPTWALDDSVPAIHGEISRSLLGDGTGVVIGIIDSGIDEFHPALAGTDSLGNARQVAKGNFAAGGPTIHGHGTWVASAALSSDPIFTGMAPDAGYVNARVLDSTNGFPNDVPVRNGLGFAIDQGADVLNLSLNYFSPNSSGGSQLDLMLDWAAQARGISCALCAGNISTGSGSQLVRGPGSAYNGVTVGRTTADFSRVHTDSATAFTSDGRMKPDVVAPGSLLTLANDLWETQADWDVGLNGCSFATPHVAGLMAQQIDAGNRLGMSTSPLVVKATIMNSSSKIPDKQNNPWEPNSFTNSGGLYSTSQPLDPHSGAGLVDGLTLSTQYLAGEMAPGPVNAIGWDLHSVSSGQFIDYLIDSNLISGSSLSVTLTWYRRVTRTDNGNGLVDSGDFFTAQSVSNLNLQVLRGGVLVAQSISSAGNLEHLHLPISKVDQYTLRVSGSSVFGSAEQFALAWYGTAVPEPGSVLLAAIAASLFGTSRNRRPTLSRHENS